MLPDLSGLSSLSHLVLITTQVESLSHLPSPLKRIYATDAKIKQVDLSGLENLEYFDVSFKPLENIVMTGLHNLRF
jgi:Leucine-rich repeat (LRR) protein